MIRAALLALVVLTQAGCVEILALGVSAISTGVGIYQRKSSREAQDEQTAEIKALREEIARLRVKWGNNYEPTLTPTLTFPLSEGGVVLPRVQDR